jgi:hypothetical protein
MKKKIHCQEENRMKSSYYLLDAGESSHSKWYSMHYAPSMEDRSGTRMEFFI